MLRSGWVGLLLAVCWGVPVFGQTDPSSLEGYFTGKMVVAKIDMPGSEKGVDLAFNKPVVLDPKSYSSSLVTFGVAIHKGDAVQVTKVLVKGDHIEFQLGGGGFGVAGDDTNTVVAPVVVAVSDREKDLVKQIAAEKDAKRKQDLQHDLDQERARRAQQQAMNNNAATVASQMKAQQVMQRRLQGGSRFNLKWQGTVPSDDRDPDTVTKLLADYVDFDASHANPASMAGGPAPLARSAYVPAAGATPADIGQLQRSMKMDDVFGLLGQGQMTSQSVSSDGLKTQVFEFKAADRVVDVTFVEGVVVKYSISSN
jgi:hypothetical protein